MYIKQTNITQRCKKMAILDVLNKVVKLWKIVWTATFSTQVILIYYTFLTHLMILISAGLIPCLINLICLWDHIFLLCQSFSLTLCSCSGAWGTVGGAAFFCLHFVSSCLPLAAVTRYCSGGPAPGPCSETFSVTTAAAAPVCQTAPVWSHPRISWAVADNITSDNRKTSEINKKKSNILKTDREWLSV